MKERVAAGSGDDIRAGRVAISIVEGPGGAS